MATVAYRMIVATGLVLAIVYLGLVLTPKVHQLLQAEYAVYGDNVVRTTPDGGVTIYRAR